MTEEGAYKGVERMHLLAGFGLSFMLALIVTISFAVGSNTIKGLLDLIPEFIQHGLSVATGDYSSARICDACTLTD